MATGSREGEASEFHRAPGETSSRGPEFDYDYWLFDLDGTLIDTAPAYRRSLFERIGERLGYRFSDEEVERLWYGLGDGRTQCLRSLDIEPDRFWRLFHDEEDPKARADATFLFEDALVLKEISVPVGLVTHCQDYLTGPVLETLGIRDWFDSIVCCTDETGWKPDRQPIDLVTAEMEISGRSPQGVFVGDDPYDTGAAWNAGLDSIHVERVDPAARGHCVMGDYRVSTLFELRTGIA